MVLAFKAECTAMADVTHPAQRCSGVMGERWWACRVWWLKAEIQEQTQAHSRRGRATRKDLRRSDTLHPPSIVASRGKGVSLVPNPPSSCLCGGDHWVLHFALLPAHARCPLPPESPPGAQFGLPKVAPCHILVVEGSVCCLLLLAGQAACLESAWLAFSVLGCYRPAMLASWSACLPGIQRLV